MISSWLLSKIRHIKYILQLSNFGAIVANVCAWWAEIDWHLIQSVFLPQDQCFSLIDFRTTTNQFLNFNGLKKSVFTVLHSKTFSVLAGA